MLLAIWFDFIHPFGKKQHYSQTITAVVSCTLCQPNVISLDFVYLCVVLRSYASLRASTVQDSAATWCDWGRKLKRLLQLSLAYNVITRPSVWAGNTMQIQALRHRRCGANTDEFQTEWV